MGMVKTLKGNTIQFFLLSALLGCSEFINANDTQLKFALIPQGAGNDFFLDAKAGCEKASSDLSGVECIYGGPQQADVRTQTQYINKLIQQGIDGIAVSVIDSDYLAENIVNNTDKKIPIISFNSGFDIEALSSNQNLSPSYVGTNNYQLGWELGQLTKNLRPQGGKLCLISGHKTSIALQKRMDGARAALVNSSDPSISLPPLNGDNNWTEYSRCPFYSNDLPHRALKQLQHTLEKSTQDSNIVDTIIVVGAWPQQNEQAYRELMTPYKEILAAKKVVVVIGDTMKPQIRLLEENLAHANVGQSPYQMGYQSIKLLKMLVRGEPVPDVMFTPIVKCLPDQVPICRE